MAKHNGSVRGILVLALAATVLAACSPIPYSAAIPRSVQRQLERELGEAPPDQSGAEAALRKRAISLCYSRALNTPEELLAEARLICGSGQVKFLESDIFWTPCSLQQPARATFICTPEQSVREAPDN